VHAVALCAVLVAGLPGDIAIAAAGILAASAACERPRGYSGTLICRADGRFDLPDEGRANLTLGAASTLTQRWARLVLVDRSATVTILLLRDQLDDAGWRLLSAQLGAAR
jgi:hypothetical protein